MHETPRRNLRSGSVDSRVAPQLKPKFPYTEKWNNIVNTFLKDCPRSRHRRQFTYVDDSFTGKEAVDFMMEAIPKTLLNGREVTRDSCTKLLQKFMEEGHFYRYGSHEGKERVFKDNNWLYCFFATPATAKPQTPKLIRRSSFSASIQKKLQSLTPTSSPDFNGQIPNSPPQDNGFHRRRSMSCNNLLELTNLEPARILYERRSREPVRVIDTTPTCDRTRDGRDDKEGIYESLKTNIIEKIRRRKGSPSPVPIAPAEPKLISKAMITTPCALPPPKVVTTVTPGLNEIDMWSVYKTCLLNRLKYLMGINDSFLSWSMKGYHIKWNCERIDKAGIVMPRSKSDSYSDYIMRLINYLMMFPFPNENVNAVKYDEFQETKVFTVLCSNLEKGSALLSEEEAVAILHAMNYFDELSREITPDREYSPPMTRSRSNLHKTPVPVPVSFYKEKGSTPSSTYSELPAAIRTNGVEARIGFALNKSDSFDASPSEYVTPITRPRAMTDSMSAMSIQEVRSLPGLILTPEMDNQIKTYYHSPKSGSGSRPRPLGSRVGSGLSYATAMTHFSPFRQHMGPIQYGSLLTTISLIFLTLPTARRWKLHTLLRLMKRISTDDNLKLDPERSNKDMVLEKLSKAIIPTDKSITSQQAIDIVKVLLCGDVIYGIEKFFQVDKELLKAVKEMSLDIVKQRMASTELEELNNAPTPENNVVQYCELTTTNSYQEQTSHTDEHLLPLLDSIINNENMKPADKGRKLKQFKAAHPDIYSKRFPLEEIQKADGNRGFLRRVFSLR